MSNAVKNPKDQESTESTPAVLGAIYQQRRRTLVVAVAQARLNPRRLKVGRNQPCPCGSGRKFKHCHLAPPKPEQPADKPS